MAFVPLFRDTNMAAKTSQEKQSRRVVKKKKKKKKNYVLRTI